MDALEKMPEAHAQHRGFETAQRQIAAAQAAVVTVTARLALTARRLQEWTQIADLLDLDWNQACVQA